MAKTKTQKVSSAVRTGSGSGSTPSSSRFGKLSKWITVAAVVVLAGGIGSYFVFVSHADTLGNQKTYTNGSQSLTVSTFLLSTGNDVVAYANFQHTQLSSATLVEYQCSASGCGVISAYNVFHNDSLGGANINAEKPFSFGHTYKACVSFTATSGWHIVNACSPLSSFGHGA